jgi:asparagine synthase (glutamine-hydrolysing)
MAQRGPDAESFFVDEEQSVYLGHRRLAVIDVRGGKQPMRSGDGRYTLVFNGAIYNAPELRLELEKEGVSFESDHSDTEVLLEALIHWGTDSLPRLNGMWAFVLYDSLKHSLFCSRDRFGQKPFYFSQGKDYFAFSSQMDSLLLHPAVSGTIHPLSLKKYIVYGYVPEPATLVSSVSKLPAGSFLTCSCSTGECSLSSFWDFQIQPREPSLSLNELGEELRELLQRAVSRRLLADEKPGLFLSGGLDSSIIALMAAGTPVKPECFSIGFSGVGFDETPFSTMMAERLELKLHVTRLDAEHVLDDAVRILGEVDDPIGDSSLVPTALLCRETAKHVKVALGGDGADELFAGYTPFMALGKAAVYRRVIPSLLHRFVATLVNQLPVSHRYMSLDFKLKKTLDGLQYPEKFWLPVWMGAVNLKDLNDLFQEPVAAEELFEDALEIWESCSSGNSVDRALMFFTKLYLNHSILHKVDRAGMMNSLEVRTPFLDVDVADFAMKLPARFKMRGTRTKYLLRHAFKGILPDEILKRSKHGFALPVGAWMQSGLLTEEKNRLTLLSSDFVSSAWHRHRMNKRDERLFLWNLLSLNRNPLFRSQGIPASH